MKERPLTTGEIAQYCNVSRRTIVKWINEGKINVYQTPGKHSRVKREDFLKFLKKYNMLIPEELSSNGGKKKILIVDDDHAMVSTLKRILQVKSNYIIEVAYDGFSAGAKFNAFKPDVILLDIKMPKMDGFEVCSMIRKDPKNKDTKIIIISGHVDEGETKKMFELGADAFFPKPFESKELKEKIENLLEKDQSIHKEKKNG